MGCRIYILKILMTCFFLWCYGKETEQVKMTLVSLNHFNSEENSHYQCSLSSPDNDPDEVTVESMRTGWTRSSAGKNPNPPDAVYDTTTDYPHYKVNMTNNGNNNAFGVFGCKASSKGKKETIISTTRMRSNETSLNDLDESSCNELKPAGF